MDLASQMEMMSLGSRPPSAPAAAPAPAPGVCRDAGLEGLGEAFARLGLGRAPCLITQGAFELRGVEIGSPWFIMGHSLAAGGQAVALGHPAHLGAEYLYLHMGSALLRWPLAALRGGLDYAAAARLEVGPLEGVYFIAGPVVCWRRGDSFFYFNAATGRWLRHPRPVYGSGPYTLEAGAPGGPATLWAGRGYTRLALPAGEVVGITPLHVAVREGPRLHLCYIDGSGAISTFRVGDIPASQLVVTESGVIHVSGAQLVWTREPEGAAQAAALAGGRVQAQQAVSVLLSLQPGQQFGRIFVDGERLLANASGGGRHWLCSVQ